MGGCLIESFIHNLTSFLPFKAEWLGYLAMTSLVTFVLSLILIPWIITRLPLDYFIDEKRHKSSIHKQHPLVYISLILIKNLLGGILLVAGIIMLVLPGQGILTILVGLGLLDFPAKFRLMRALAKKPSVFKSMNWIRKKANVEALIRPE